MASSATSSSDSTRAPTTPAEYKIDSTTGKPIQTDHVDLHHFDREGHNELERRLSRVQSNFSTRTQDPTADDFDYEQHLRHVLRKRDANGVLSRDLGVQFKDLKVRSQASPSFGEDQLR